MPGHYNAAPQNHHYGKRKGESVKQERMDLLKDNPVVRDMTSNRPWMSKHFKSTMGSAVRMDHEGSPATAAKPDFPDIDGDGNTSESMKQAAADKKKGSPAKMKKGEKDEKSGKSKPKLKDFQSKEGKGPRVGDVKPGTIIPTGGSPYKDKKKKGSPAKKYDRVVLGGNKGDKSKTKPGKKDYSGNQPDLKKYSEDKKKK